MLPTLNIRYVWCLGGDGKTTSVCSQCVSIVGRSQWEADLDDAEQTHVCYPERMAHLRDLATKPIKGRLQ
jgi:hypothetical protein